MPGRAVVSRALRPSVAIIALTLAAPAFALQPQTDNEARQAIIPQSAAAYNATGHPCACPISQTVLGIPAVGEAPTAVLVVLHRCATRRMSRQG
jgi:hypothetical protein